MPNSSTLTYKDSLKLERSRNRKCFLFPVTPQFVYFQLFQLQSIEKNLNGTTIITLLTTAAFTLDLTPTFPCNTTSKSNVSFHNSLRKFLNLSILKRTFAVKPQTNSYCMHIQIAFSFSKKLSCLSR